MRKQRRHVVLSAPEVSLTVLSSINSLLIDRNWRAGIANSNASGARLILSSGKEFRSFFPKPMADEVDEVKQTQLVDARARNISHNVRCTECGSQSIEDSQADIAILLRKLIRDEIHAGKSDKDIYKKLENEFGETVLYAPKFDRQTAALWLSPLIVAGGAVGVWAYKRRREKTNVHIMALNLVRGVALTPKEKQTMLDILTPPPTRGTTPFSWWKRWQGR